MRVGVDASNIRAGGGVTHLGNMISALALDLDVELQIWCGVYTAGRLSNASSSVAVHLEPQLDGHLAQRTMWRQWRLPRLLRNARVDCLLSPGGLLPFRQSVPTVVMSQNALPFEAHELKRYRITELARWRFEYLRIAQKRSFRRADRIIALSGYARRLLSESGIDCPVDVIPHGVEERFFTEREYSAPYQGKFTLVYVSPVHRYKHQARVVEAVSRAARRYPLRLQLVGGSADPRAMGHLESAIRQFDPSGELVERAGHVPHERLHEVLAAADVFVFASTCESFPNTVLEAMAAGLPVLSTAEGPMPEILGDAGLYFDVARPLCLEERLEELLADSSLQQRLGEHARNRARQFSWQVTAQRTAEVLSGASEVR